MTEYEPSNGRDSIPQTTQTSTNFSLDFGWVERITGMVKNGIRNGLRAPIPVIEPEVVKQKTSPIGVQLASKEHKTGVFVMPSNMFGDEIVVFGGQAYLENFEYLVDAATLFAQRNIGWSSEFSGRLMKWGMNVNTLANEKELSSKVIRDIMKKPTKEREVPSAFLFRQKNAPEGLYVGISVQRMLYIEATSIRPTREIAVLDNVLRAMEIRQKDRGKVAVAMALFYHRGANRFIHKSPNPVAHLANMHSPFLLQTGRCPLDVPIGSDPLETEIYTKAAEHILFPNRIISPTGVIENDYEEPARGFDPNDLTDEALEVWKLLQERGVNERSPMLSMYIVAGSPI